MRAPDFQDVVAEFYPILYRFGLALSRSEADAADLTQQVFYLWATKGHQLQDGSKVKSWLFTSLYREFLRQKRRANIFFEREELVEPRAAEIDSATCAADKLDGEIAKRALFELDEIYRAPLALFYLQEHSYAEIAEILEIPIGTIMSRLSRGKAKLRKLLDDAIQDIAVKRGRDEKKKFRCRRAPPGAHKPDGIIVIGQKRNLRRTEMRH